MRLVAFAAFAAAFWLSVATLRLMLHGGPCPTPAEPRAAPAPQARIEFSPPPLMIAPMPPVIFGPLTHAEVVAELEKLRLQIRSCEDGVAGKVTVDFSIHPDGTVRSAYPSGALAGTAAGFCVTEAVLSARFHPSETGLDAVHTFRLR